MCGSEWQRTTPTSQPNTFTRSAGLKKWAIPPGFTASMADSWRTPKRGHYTPLSAVALIFSSCSNGGYDYV
nr:MAG TPA: hypothetical protein [Caudoviricetes sp.]